MNLDNLVEFGKKMFLFTENGEFNNIGEKIDYACDNLSKFLDIECKVANFKNFSLKEVEKLANSKNFRIQAIDFIAKNVQTS